MAENHLTKQFDALHIFRPGYIYPVEKRNEPNLMYRFSRFIYPALKAIFPSHTALEDMLTVKDIFSLSSVAAQVVWFILIRV